MDIPEVVSLALDRGARMSISVSGGKDSQAMLSQLGEIEASSKEIVHADLGRAEWPQTPQFVDDLSASSKLPLAVVRRAKGDLVQRIEERLKSVSTVDPTRPAKPFWPSSAQRYCTSDLKRDPIQKHQRSFGKNELIISCVGFRKEESTTRRKRPTLSIERKITFKQYRDLEPLKAVKAWDGEGRLVITWYPIHEWELGRVWEELGTSHADVERRQGLYKSGEVERSLEGWGAHPAYVFGNERLSCALCVLASKGDLCNGRDHNPELFQKYVELEQQSGYTFRDGFSLTELATVSG